LLAVGMLLFNDEKNAPKAKQPHSGVFKHDQIGYNYRMSNINATIGLAQLEQLDDIETEISPKLQDILCKNFHPICE
jgi:dTDP-4-amino-4,6-dideoxygalactose transaminase